MSDKTGIGWTNATWNPVTGCSRVSPGCEHCYAEALSLRYGWSKKPWTAQNAAENVVLHPERLGQPLRWRKPRRVFVNSMSDLFHERVPDTFLLKAFTIMAQSLTWAKGDRHIYQVLTKRPERMRDFLSRLSWKWGTRMGGPWRMPETGDRPLNPVATLRGDGDPSPMPEIWLGVSVEDQRRADERIPILLETPAAVRWISAEPLLGPLWLEGDGRHLLGPASQRAGMNDGLDWVVVGGESGPGHRPMDPAWLESIVRQCQAAKVPVFVKQASGARPGQQGRIPDDLWALKEYPA